MMLHPWDVPRPMAESSRGSEPSKLSYSVLFLAAEAEARSLSIEGFGIASRRFPVTGDRMTA
jgi:hypothetical protein